MMHAIPTTGHPLPSLTDVASRVKASEFPDIREFRASCCRCSTSMYVDTGTITIKFHDNERVTLRWSEVQREGKIKRMEDEAIRDCRGC